ncbi:phage major capsid protein [Frankia sp. Mgl5]|uniref:phage major capsid protein n=1 Tax=Frankia sp. Mgl5 TaxID=2933793 RepID=UPI00200C6AA3|nr:phage major capsid protein [Frankia sp. Mgl5]MCK9928797.1 phage major capsid protein [Frankia sp. Mgl5]
MSKTPDELRAGIRKELEAARAIAAKAETEGREFTADEMATVKTHIDEGQRLKGLLEKAGQGASLLAALKGLEGAGLVDQRPTPSAVAGGTKGSMGQRVVAGLDPWLKSAFPGGRIPDSARGVQSPPVILGKTLGRKALITGESDTSAGALVRPDYDGVVDTYVGPPLIARGLLTIGSTATDTVEYVREGARTNNAAPVAEATTAAPVGSGSPEVTPEQAGVKPESGFVLEKDSTTVKTIAHWIPATKRALADPGQIRTLIDSFLLDGLAEQLEYQIFNGSGTGEDLLGVLNTPGTQAQAWDTDLLTTARKAKTKIRRIGRRVPNAYVLNPEDAERFDLLKDGENRYYFGGPVAAGEGPTLWGLPRLESEEVPAGTGLLADWRMAVLIDREQASVQVSDSHADFFTRNLVAFLAELRAAFYIRRPSAFIEIDLTA